MRIRIALTTAVAVFIAVPSFLLMLFSNTSAASTGATPHESRHATARVHRESSTRHDVRIADSLTSYRVAQKTSQLVTYADAVQSAKQSTFFKDVVFFTDLSFFQAVAQQQAGSLATMPAAWVPTALCEEGGRDDPHAGFFGILEWNGFDGYPTAGSAPLSVQLAWEAAHGQGPPDAPGQCHGY